MAGLKITNAIVFDLDGNLNRKVSGKLYHRCGFDPDGRFQMMPIGAQQVFSVAGGSAKDLTFKFSPGSGGSFKFIDQDMTIQYLGTFGLATIEAVTVGDCALELVNSQNKTIDRIDVKIVGSNSVATRFYNLIDSTGRRGLNSDSPMFAQSALASLVDQVNLIVSQQCFVSMKLNGEGLLRDLNVAGDMESSVVIEKQHSPLFASTDIDRTAEYHVIFAWDLPTHAAGITLFAMSLIKQAILNRPFPPACTIAHEFVHFLSPAPSGREDHDKERSDLMNAGPADEHGIMMREERLLKARASH
jgi:hypothetical protein